MTGIILGVMRILASIFSTEVMRFGVVNAVELRQLAMVPSILKIVATAIRHLCRPPAQWSAS